MDKIHFFHFGALWRHNLQKLPKTGVNDCYQLEWTKVSPFPPLLCTENEGDEKRIFDLPGVSRPLSRHDDLEDKMELYVKLIHHPEKYFEKFQIAIAFRWNQPWAIQLCISKMKIKYTSWLHISLGFSAIVSLGILVVCVSGQ